MLFQKNLFDLLPEKAISLFVGLVCYLLLQPVKNGLIYIEMYQSIIILTSFMFGFLMVVCIVLSVMKIFTFSSVFINQVLARVRFTVLLFAINLVSSLFVLGFGVGNFTDAQLTEMMRITLAFTTTSVLLSILCLTIHKE